MNLDQALEILIKIEKEWFDCYYPLKHCMYDKQMTVGEVYIKCMSIIKEAIK